MVLTLKKILENLAKPSGKWPFSSIQPWHLPPQALWAMPSSCSPDAVRSCRWMPSRIRKKFKHSKWQMASAGGSVGGGGGRYASPPLRRPCLLLFCSSKKHKKQRLSMYMSQEYGVFLWSETLESNNHLGSADCYWKDRGPFEISS